MIKQSILCIVCIISLYFVGCLGDFVHVKYKQHDKTNQIIPRRYMAEVNNYDEFLQDMKKYDIKIHRTIRHPFLNSFSFEINQSEKEPDYSTLKSILDHDNVKKVTPVRTHKRSEFMDENLIKKSPEEAGYRSTHRLLQIDRVHRELNLTGEGIFIAVIDSGVDYLHPALGGGYGPGFKIHKGYDFVGKEYGTDKSPVPQPDDDPYDDCTVDDELEGHGTSTIGIIGGFDPVNNFTGVAPNAKLGAYRVFGCNGTTETDIVYEAITKAVDDGADIISLSLGSAIPWAAPDGYASNFFAQIREKGVVVVVAAGNEGDYGIYTSSDPGVVNSVISVGGTYNEYNIYDGSFTVTSMHSPINYKLLSIGYNGTKLYMTDGELTPSFNGIGRHIEDACNAKNISSKVTGRIALVKRGTCSFAKRSKNLALAGAIGVIQYDFSPPFGDENLVLNSTIPFAFISFDDGIKLAKLVQNNTISVKFSKNRSTIYKKNPFSGVATSFSSLGPSAELNLKPDILAVAGDVYTIAPRYMGGWTIFDGTSAAAPLVSGSVALYLQHLIGKKIPVKEIAEQFQNYASARNAVDANATDNPIRIGAGIIQVYDSIVQTTHVTPSQISFNDTSSQEYKTHNLTITNNGQNSVSYRVFNNASIAISPYDREKHGYFLIGIPKTKTADATLQFSSTEIHLEAGQSQTLTVTVIPPNTDPLDHIVYGGFVQFDPIIHTTSTASKSFHVPYIGVVGKQYDLPIVNTDIEQEVSQIIDEKEVVIDEYILDFTKNKTDLIIKFMTYTPTKILRREIFSDRNCTKFFGYASSDSVFNPQYDVYPSYFTFDGSYIESIPADPFADDTNFTYSEQPIPNGEYYLRQKLLKIFGDMNKESDWEYVKTGPIVIKRE